MRGDGPFASAELHDSLILLQVFMGVLAGTALLLAAAHGRAPASEQREQRGRRRAAAARGDADAGAASRRGRHVRVGRPQSDGALLRRVLPYLRPAGRGRRDHARRMGGLRASRRSRPHDRAPGREAIEGAEPAAADYRITGRRRPRRGGSAMPASCSGPPDGDRMLGTVLDITERKAARSGVARITRPS